MHPADPLSEHFRLTTPQRSALTRLHLSTVGDLLRHVPVRYERAGGETTTAQLVSGEKVTLYGTFTKLEAKKLWKSRRSATEGWFEDSSGRVKVLWFNQPYIAKMVIPGTFVKMTGSVAGNDKPYITNPEIEAAAPGAAPAGMFVDSSARLDTPALFPVYPETRGITSRWFYHALAKVFATGAYKQLDDPLPSAVRTAYHLPDLASSLVWIHKPEKFSHAESARKRFAFEEMFSIAVFNAQERTRSESSPGFALENAPERAAEFLARVPFAPTSAQKRAIDDILTDVARPHPMHRLLEGDVGSGKTLVAAATAYAVVTARPRGQNFGTLQVAYMAPTEILATQHFQSFIEYFQHLPISMALITGKVCKKFPSKSAPGTATDISRAQLLKWVAQGEIALLVGTHALIQKSVRFKHLAYAIVDEQHRFGVRQRAALVRGKTQTTSSFDDTQKNAEIGDGSLLYENLSYKVRGVLFDVRKKIGLGHKEKVYQRAVEIALQNAHIPYEREKQIPVLYENKKVGTYQPDFIIGGKILLELKALPRLMPREKTQVWQYIKGSDYRLALLANFGAQNMEIERIVHDSARAPRLSAPARHSFSGGGSSPQHSAQEVRSIPHYLSMTATPIPRTLALTLYGDLDLSILDELPPGRATVATEVVTPKSRERAYARMRSEIAAGRQAYIICPRIEEPDPAQFNALQAKSAKAEAKRLAHEVFPDFRIDLLHGGMTPKEKDAVMQKFSAGTIDILVATSVVEVGVNVPNATVILIEGAERFGLAQLHQLRGRIQRSTHQPYCFLLAETMSAPARERLKALEKSADGFALAEADLKARGAGNLLGDRQWGVSDLGMEALQNARLIRAAREEAAALVATDPDLSQHPTLKARVARIETALHSE